MRLRKRNLHGFFYIMQINTICCSVSSLPCLSILYSCGSIVHEELIVNYQGFWSVPGLVDACLHSPLLYLVYWSLLLNTINTQDTKFYCEFIHVVSAVIYYFERKPFLGKSIFKMKLHTVFMPPTLQLGMNSSFENQIISFLHFILKFKVTHEQMCNCSSYGLLQRTHDRN